MRAYPRAPRAHTPSENTAKVIIYSVGGVAYHLLEHVALIMSLIRQVDEKLIPKTKEWLVRVGVWERGDDFDAYAQWCWLIDSLCGVYLGLCNYRRAEVRGLFRMPPQMLVDRRDGR